MNSVKVSLKELFGEYKNWVCRNPQTASDLESILKWISYIAAGKVNKSLILTEWVHSVSNLLILFNDQIIHSSKKNLVTAADKIKVWLTVLEYSEVLFEKSGKSLGGERGRWLIIFMVQLLKCATRLTLLLQYKEKIISCPPIPPLRRFLEKTSSEKCNDANTKVNNAFALKRTGRVIRKVHSAPPMHNRLWKPPVLDFHSSDEILFLDKSQLQKHLGGEMLFIIKPIVHLLTLRKYGKHSWKHWALALAMDITSLYLLYSQPKHSSKSSIFTPAQQLEISRRRLSLLLYLMKSPCYETATRNQILTFLDVLGRRLPSISNSFKQYLPYWQDTYFYLWSS